MPDPAPLYDPTSCTFSSDPAVAQQWVFRNLQDIADVFQRALGRELEVASAPPARPQDGWVRVADGTNWDPGNGPGAYLFFDGEWQPLGGGGGGLPGPGTITHDMLGTGIVWTPNLGDSSVTTEKIGDAQVITVKIGDLQITTEKLADGSVKTPKLFDGAVLEAKLGDLAVSLQKLGVGAVDFSKILPGAVQEVSIGNDAVTNAKIADLAVGTLEIQATAVTTAKIAAGAITTNQLGALAVLAQNIGAGEVTATKIGAQAVVAGKVAAGAITSNELATGSVTALKIGVGEVTANAIAAGAIVSAKIASAQIVSNHIAAGQITSTHIAANSISVDRLASSGGIFGATNFYLGTSISITGIQSGASFYSNVASNFALIVGNTAGGTALGCGSAGHTGIAITGINSSSSFFTFARKTGSIGNSEWAGWFTSDAGRSVQLCTDSFAVVYSGGVSGTFTGGHDGLFPKTGPLPQPGDILVDGDMVITDNIYDTIGYVERSTSAYQVGVIGVFGEEAKNHKPSAMLRKDKATRLPEIAPKYKELYESHRYLVINAIGEGLINVCGQNGDIAKGDLIVASDRPGKGMRQDDNIVRNYTVARAREGMAFANANQVKQIACIYLAG